MHIYIYIYIYIFIFIYRHCLSDGRGRDNLMDDEIKMTWTLGDVKYMTNMVSPIRQLKLSSLTAT